LDETYPSCNMLIIGLPKSLFYKNFGIRAVTIKKFNNKGKRKKLPL
jgi:hypothetical protein